MMLKYAVVAVVLLICLQTLAAHTLYKRSLEESSNPNTSKVVEICEGKTPCGWAIYKRINRYIDYFMKNTCVCPKETKCLRDEDDISIRSYVYRCNILENTS